MTSTLSGSVAVVAGGARGIGRACALRLADLDGILTPATARHIVEHVASLEELSDVTDLMSLTAAVL